MSFFVGDFFAMMFLKERTSDFYEMLLHHVATCVLYFSAVWGNYMVIGGVTCFCHDIGDILTTCVRLLSCTTFETASVVTYLILLLVWIWTRLIVVPLIMYNLWTVYYPDSMYGYGKFMAI